MSGAFWASVAFVAAWPVAMVQVRRQWRGTDSSIGRVFDPERQRSLPAATALALPFFGSGAVLLASHGAVRSLAAAVWLVTLIAFLILVPSLHYWGKPRRLVPPHLRDLRTG